MGTTHNPIKAVGSWFEHAAGHGSAEVSGHGIGKWLSEKIGAMLTAGKDHIATIAGIGLMAGVNAALTQGEYNKKRRELIEIYKDELSTTLGKEAGKLKHKEVRKLAEGDAEKGIEGNRTLAGALDKLRRQRNLSIALAVIATVASMSLLTPLLPALAPGVGLMMHAGYGLIGLLTYNAIKMPLHWVGDKIFGVEKETAHDRITALQKERDAGKFITREQVFSVFASATPELSEMIGRKYGSEYDELSVAKRQHIAADIGRMIKIDQITDAINHGKMDATELAFTVEGQASGFDPNQISMPIKKGFFTRIKDAILGRTQEEKVPAVTLPAMPHYADAPSQPSFVKKLGMTKAATNLGHVERLEQSRAEASLLQQR